MKVRTLRYPTQTRARCGQVACAHSKSVSVKWPGSSRFTRPPWSLGLFCSWLGAKANIISYPHCVHVTCGTTRAALTEQQQREQAQCTKCRTDLLCCCFFFWPAFAANGATRGGLVRSPLFVHLILGWLAVVRSLGVARVVASLHKRRGDYEIGAAEFPAGALSRATLANDE